jgi:hypothetical protein
MNDSQDVITIIVPETLVVATERDGEDLGGGETQADVKTVVRHVFGIEQSIDMTTARENLERCMSQVRVLLQDVERHAAGAHGWELSEVSISLTMNAQGSIGIATAGLAATIQVKLTPRARAKQSAARR